MNTQKIANLEAEIAEYNSEIASLEAKLAEYKSEISIRRGLIVAARMEDDKARRAELEAKAKPVVVMDYFNTPLAEVKLVPVHEGRKVAYKGREIKVGQAWDVLLDGEIIGSVEYRMFTRETRSAGRMYVNSRWESPGWGYTTDSKGFGRQLEASSKKDALERIVRAASRRP